MTAKLTANERLERMLAIVPWVAAHPEGVSLSELSERFDLTIEQLQSCFGILFMVGHYPYTPDALVEVFFDGDHVTVRLPGYFSKPLRLTAEQTFALVAAGRSVLATPGADPDGPLARGLEKIAGVMGIDQNAILEVDLGDVSEDLLEQLRTARDERRSVEIDYYSYGRDASSRRRIDPWRVQAVSGFWYVEGWCHLAQAVRSFRVDRIESLTALSDRFDPPPERPELVPFRPDASTPRVTLELETSAAWVASQYPSDEVVHLDDGRLRVTIAVAEKAWLERLMIRLGPEARIVSADGDLRDAGREMARRLLDRYAG